MKILNTKMLLDIHKQRGVVLFFALIALVAMSLAAVALIRAVDTNSMISGNISFKQSTLTSADQGVETAIVWAKGNPSLLNADSDKDGYYATSLLAARALVDASGMSDGMDTQGNKIFFVVQRMCTKVGAPAPENCLYGPRDDSSSPCALDANGVPNPNCIQNPGPAYRITSKVIGPKNTVSYIQAFVY